MNRHVTVSENGTDTKHHRFQDLSCKKSIIKIEQTTSGSGGSDSHANFEKKSATQRNPKNEELGDARNFTPSLQQIHTFTTKQHTGNFGQHGTSIFFAQPNTKAATRSKFESDQSLRPMPCMQQRHQRQQWAKDKTRQLKSRVCARSNHVGRHPITVTVNERLDRSQWCVILKEPNSHVPQHVEVGGVQEIPCAFEDSSHVFLLSSHPEVTFRQTLEIKSLWTDEPVRGHLVSIVGRVDHLPLGSRRSHQIVADGRHSETPMREEIPSTLR